MSDTTTITPEERALWASVATARINAVTPERQCEITAQERLVKALKALEQAEARAEKAEADVARLRARLEPQERLHSVMKEARNQMNAARRAVADVESDLEQAKSMNREEYFKFCHGDWDEALRREDAARDPEERRAVAAGEE